MAKPETSNTTETTLAQGPVRGPEGLTHAVAALLHNARREVRLFAPHLDPLIFSAAAVTSALVRFAAAHPRNRARLLIEDVLQARRDNPALLDLLRRLADRIELRAVDDGNRGARDLYLVADRAAYLRQEDASRNDGIAAADAPYDAAQLIDRFDAAWEHGVPVALRTLGL